MKNFLPLLVVVICSCAAAAEAPSGGYSGAGDALGVDGGNGSGAAAGAKTTAGAGNTLGGFGSGGANGSSGTTGASGSGGASNAAGAFGAAGTSFGGASFGGASFGGASFGGNAGRGGAGAGGNAGRGGAGSGGSGMITQVCTSKKTWTNGNGTDMRPGNDCTGCHNFAIAGTVYPTLDEPNNCDGTGAGGIKVLITGADNVTLTLTPSATSGNFYSSSSVKTPYSVKLTNSAGASRSMVAHQTAGNCNSCHTPTGANGAPGRITAP
jgi:hypothetical protein